MIAFITTIALLIILAVIILVVLERIIAAHKENNVLTEHIRTLLEISEKTCENMIKITESFQSVLEKQSNIISKIIEDYNNRK